MEDGVVTKARSRRHSRIRYAYFYVDRRFFFLLSLSLSLSLSLRYARFPLLFLLPTNCLQTCALPQISLSHSRSTTLTFSPAPLSLSLSLPPHLFVPIVTLPTTIATQRFSLSLSPVSDRLLACLSPSSLRLQPRRLAPRDFLRSLISLHDRSSHASLFRVTLYFPSSRHSLVLIRVVAA